MGQTRIGPAEPLRLLARNDGSRLLLPGGAAERGIVLLHGAQETPETILQNIDLEALAHELGAAILLPALGNSFGLGWGEGQDYRRCLLEELLPRAGEQCACFARRESCAAARSTIPAPPTRRSWMKSSGPLCGAGPERGHRPPVLGAH